MFLTLFCAVLAVGWWVLFLRTRRSLRAALRPQPGAQPVRQPLVSVLVPARNESKRALEEAVGSLLAQDYREFEILAVDDNSTDSTRTILEQLAHSRPDTIRVISGEPPPPGWFGKPWALEQARRRARGELLLATDADVVHQPGSIRAGVALLEEKQLDALTLFPRVELKSFWERAVLPTIAWMMIVSSRFDQANDPRSPVSLGCGAYLLVRRSALDALGGYSAVRQQINEDGWTLRLLKRAGFRTGAGNGSLFLRTRLYRSWGEIWSGFGKSMFPAVNFSWFRTLRVLATSWLLGPVLMGLFGLALLGSLLGAASLWHGVVGAALVGQVSTALLFGRPLRLPVGYAFLAGVGLLLASLILLQSAWKIGTGRGVSWKGRWLYQRGVGTLYPARWNAGE